MQSKEIRATGKLIGTALGGTATLIQEMHAAIAARPFRAVGQWAVPVRAVHDPLAGTAYRAVSKALGALPERGAAALARTTSPDAPSLSDSLRGSIALGALNGAIGDALDRGRSELALPMTIRRRGHDLATDRAGLARAYPDATERLAVFVHGLSETDEAWRLIGGEGPRRSYGSRLREELGYTPLYLRYNSGLRISDNGRRLSELLDQVVEGWPVEVGEIALVGHSMGGLVARSACHYGDSVPPTPASWAPSVRHVFCLGSPHLGAPLEKAANVAAHVLTRFPDTRPLGRLVNGRSVGIKDLRFGSCVEEDWCDCDPDEFLRDRCREVPFLDCATYYFVGATLTRDANGFVGSLVGDLMVRFPSASGQGRRRRIPFEIGTHVGGANHFQLLNHPAVYEQILAWIEPES